MSVEETKDLAYWERNVLALHYAEGWYNDDEAVDPPQTVKLYAPDTGEFHEHVIDKMPRYPGWRRVLSLEGGQITFHIPDEFDVGTLPQIEPNWDGHTTEEKWRRILARRGR